MKMKIPKAIQAMIRKAANEHKMNIDEAVRVAYEKLLKMPAYTKRIEQMLVQHSLRELICDSRHSANTKIKRDAAIDPKVLQRRLSVLHNKVVPTSSKALTAIYTKCYNLRIAGRVLGSLKGAELLSVASTEREIAGGHTFNARLCEALAPLVPKEKTVKQAVPVKKMQSIIEKLNKAA